jgi:hypothetical protein
MILLLLGFEVMKEVTMKRVIFLELTDDSEERATSIFSAEE